MPRRYSVRLASLALSNILLPIAVLVFATGFFPYKPVLPGLATFEDTKHGSSEEWQEPEAIFDRVVFMVVDALRSDFVYGYESGFEYTQSLIRSGAAIPFTAHATPPTVTMPRVKALTTGSVPSFLDLILNFAESDTTSTLASQDTWLAQIRAKGGNIVFFGDDTWLKLFPSDFFLRSDGTSSFFVSDFTEVDNNVTRHVPEELARDDWSAMIMHYLGLDHIGHKTGPQGPNMLPKQREMDGIVKQIYEAMERHEHHAKTLLVLAGDHGMNAGGNHGGSGPGETEPALLFASPRFKDMYRRMDYECPTTPKDGTDFEYYTKVQQSDLVPMLASMMGFPISKNSLGMFIPELGGLWSGPGESYDESAHLRRNAEQLLHIIRAKYGETFDQNAASYPELSDRNLADQEYVNDEEELAAAWAQVLHLDKEVRNQTGERRVRTLYYFLELAQKTMSDTASSYNVSRMVVGMTTSTITLVLAVLSFPTLWPPTMSGLALTLISALYGIMMFASSYVEEEQHFWYWLVPSHITILAVLRLCQGGEKRDRLMAGLSAASILAIHRCAVRWNQTGQKHAGEPDIVHDFFPQHHLFMWLLILAAYGYLAVQKHRRTLSGLLVPEMMALADVFLVVPAVVFKLNFTQADAPELVQGLALKLREWTEPFNLVTQARMVFSSTGLVAAMVIFLALYGTRISSSQTSAEKEDHVPLTERLHYLLTIFLMTQTRAPNVPLFLGLEIQRRNLASLVRPRATPASGMQSHPPIVEVAVAVLLLSHTYYFSMGGSNSISSIDLSNAYNGVADYNIAAVGLLLFASNWGGPIWWCSAAVLLLTQSSSDPKAAKPKSDVVDEREWVVVEREKLQQDAMAATKAPNTPISEAKGPAEEVWMSYVSCMTAFTAVALLAVMAACTALRTHLFIWTVFSPKYLYALAWALGWHLAVNIGFGSLLYSMSSM